MKTTINASPPASPRLKCTLSFLYPPQQHREDGEQEALWSAHNGCSSLCSFFLLYFPSSPAWSPHKLQFLQGKPILPGMTLSKGCNVNICCGTWSTSSSSFSDLHVHTAVSHWFHPFLLCINGIFCLPLGTFSQSHHHIGCKAQPCPTLGLSETATADDVQHQGSCSPAEQRTVSKHKDLLICCPGISS